MKKPELPVAAVQGYTRGGKKQLPYVSIWLDRLNCAQIHGQDRGMYAQHLVRCVNEREGLLKALRGLLHAYAPGTEDSVRQFGEQSLNSYVRNARTALLNAEKETT